MKSRKKRMEQKKQEQLSKMQKIFMYFAMALIFIVPLIVFYKPVNVPESASLIYGPTETLPDFFVYYKAIILAVGSFTLFFGALFYRLIDDVDFKFDLFEKLLSGLAISIIVSFILAEYKDVAILGYLDRYEGTLTWLSYIALAYSIYTFVKTKVDFNKIISAFVTSSAVISLIGFFQSRGQDFFRSDLGRKLILGSYYEELKETLRFRFPEDRVYATLFNPNYVGSLVAISFPLTLYLIFEVKNKVFKAILSGFAVIQLLVLAGSRSATGFAGIGIAVVAFIVMQLIKARVDRKRMIAVVGVVLVVFVMFTQTELFRGEYSKIKNSIETAREPVYNTFLDVEYNHPSLIVTLANEKSFTITPDGFDLRVSNSLEEEIEPSIGEETHVFSFSEEEFNVTVTRNNVNGEVILRAQDTEKNITRVTTLHLIYRDQLSLRYDPITEENIKVDVTNLISNEQSFSARGYIWNRSLPLIISKPIFGYGADTFTLHFPQIDIVGNAVAIGSQIVDKPHNFYINVLINFGFVGTIILLALMAVALVKGYKEEITISILSFLVVGIANDSVIFCTYMMFVIISLLFVREKIDENTV
jgi:hypothetical protein